MRCAINAVVVDFPLVPVIATKGQPAPDFDALAAEQFDVADHLDAGLARKVHRPMRLGMSERYARCQHQSGNLRPVKIAEIFYF